MACVQTLSGLAVNCEPSIGGLVEVYIANKSDVASIALDSDSQKVKTITMASTAKFHKYQFRRGSSSFTSTLNVDDTAGTNFVSTELTLNFAKMETTKRIEVAALALGELVVLVKDCNQKIWILGKDEAAMATSGTAQSGAARTDQNSYQIVITDYSPSWPYEVEADALTDIVA